MKRTNDSAWLKGKGRKGFTLIELIVVMAILAVLVLLAAPKFLGQTKEAQFTKHISNAKVLEDASERYYIDHGKWPRGLDEEVYTAEEVDAYADKIYDITGEELVLEEGKYWDIDYAALDAYAKLPDESERANYVLRNPVGTVYYLEGLTEEGKLRLPVAAPTENDSDTEVPTEKEIPDYYILATDVDFTKDTVGNFHYTGTAEYVIIPHVIQGVPMTSYRYMFAGSAYGVTSSPVKGVVSTNPHVTNMSHMFINSKSKTLDLSNFDTANVTDMVYMFYLNQATALDLSAFDTAKVTNMYAMFNSSQATTLDLSSFDLRSVAIGTTSATSKNWYMFNGATATTGYARTTADRDKLNNTYTYRPTGLTFVVK